MLYENSVEEQTYLSMIRKEKDAFEKLIREKSVSSLVMTLCHWMNSWWFSYALDHGNPNATKEESTARTICTRYQFTYCRRTNQRQRTTDCKFIMLWQGSKSYWCLFISLDHCGYARISKFFTTHLICWRSQDCPMHASNWRLCAQPRYVRWT